MYMLSQHIYSAWLLCVCNWQQWNDAFCHKSFLVCIEKKYYMGKQEKC